ncbi:MAG: hypothetical protein QF752_16600 [Planctomycetota bacterium]|nr:hypothetical protein [Planctomycetota bacterium]
MKRTVSCTGCGQKFRVAGVSGRIFFWTWEPKTLRCPRCRKIRVRNRTQRASFHGVRSAAQIVD